MKVWISGGTGFVGKQLSLRLLEQGHEVTAVGTRPEFKGLVHERFRYVSADTTSPGIWEQSLADADAVVNLAGRSIFHYWTEKYKQSLYDSRIITTRRIVEALSPEKTKVFCSTSAVGYYGPCGDEILTETGPNGHDFLARLAADWESEALKAEGKGIRTAVMRFGIVLGKTGGALKQMLPAFRMGMGGPLGNGMQWFPWIHIEDLVSAILYIVRTPSVKGALNFTAPEPSRQKDFAEALGRVLWRPAFIPTPGFVIKTVLGEMGKTLLSGQRAVPEKLLQSGFRFDYPEVESALENLVKN